MTASGQAGSIEVAGLTRRFGTNVAVHPFELTIGPGGITGLLGPNGSGKSTFLRLLIGLVRPDAGRATVDGAALRGDGLAVRKRVPYSPGEISLYGEARGSAQLKWLVQGRDADAYGRALQLAGELGLPLDRRVKGYSHGMKRQLLVVAALAPKARVRIFDEPTEGLDPSCRGKILELFAREAERGTTILLSSHHLGEVERACDRMLFLKEGRLLDEEEADVMHTRAKRAVRLTFKGAPDRERLDAVLSAAGADSVRHAQNAVTFVLAGGDPRAELTRLLGEIDEPESLVFGALSLQELYRELYGTEGI